jgi:hypothetical protein
VSSQTVNIKPEVVKKDGQWVTLQEASEITGKSINALRLLVKRKKFDHIKKVNGKGHGYWLIRRDSIAEVVTQDQSPDQTTQCDWSDQTIQPVMIPLERYEAERDRLMQGMMMYRYKFEELDRRVKLLPAPPEMMTNELEEKSAALIQAEKILEEAKKAQKHYTETMAELKAKLTEEEHAKEAFRIQWEQAMAEAKRPWWKKLFGAK